MSPDDFAKSMEDRGESMATMLLRMMAAGMARQATEASQAKSSDAGVADGPVRPQSGVAAETVDGRAVCRLGNAHGRHQRPDGSTLLTERNKVALAKLEKQLAQGRKRVAIFYGVGHLPDMAQRLATDFNFHETGQRWLTAWNLADEPGGGRRGQTAEPADAAK